MTTTLQPAGEAIEAAQVVVDRVALLAAENERLRTEVARMKVAFQAIDKECFSHVDGRDLFAQMHPRNTLDIKRRVDARESWFEGDWLTNLWKAIKTARPVFSDIKIGGTHE